MKIGTITQVSGPVVDVEFEAGLEESELDLSVIFDLIDGKWYVTDCFHGIYGGIPVDDFDATVYEVQQKNEQFIKKWNPL